MLVLYTSWATLASDHYHDTDSTDIGRTELPCAFIVK